MILRSPLPAALAVLAAGLAGAGCDTGPEAKIRLAVEGDRRGSVSQAESVLTVPDRSRTVAILTFENKTGDDGLEWLRRGLTDMLLTELGQSPYLRVVAAEGPEELTAATQAPAPGAAALTGIDLVLSGEFSRRGEGLAIEAELIEAGTGRSLKRETVEGEGLERVFAMVSDLSSRLRASLRDEQPTRGNDGLQVGEMTHSLEAFRAYSRGLRAATAFLQADAVREFEQAIAADPGFAAAHVRLGRVLANLGDMRGAAAAAARAEETPARLSEADRIRLRLLRSQINQDMEEFIAARSDLFKRAPYDVDARVECANLMFEFGDFDRVIEEYKVILELDPGRKLVHNQLGYIYAFRGDYTTALQHLEKYREFTPDEPNAYDSQGEILMWAGRFEEARVPLQTALEKRPDFHYSALRLAEIESELGNVEEALAYNARYEAAAPTPLLKSGARIQRAAILWRANRLDEADRAAEAALEMAPDATWNARAAVTYYRSTGRAERASRLEREVFERGRGRLAELSPTEAGGYLEFITRASLQPAEVLTVLRAAAPRQGSGLRGALHGLREHVVQLRIAAEAKGAPAASAALWPPPPEILSSLLQRRWYGDRDGTWKYLIEAMELSVPRTEPDPFATEIARAARAAKRHDLHVLARLLEAQRRARAGDEAGARAVYAEIGAPAEETWRVAGPYENRPGFHRVFPPEAPGGHVADASEGMWREVVDPVRDGFLDFNALFASPAWGVAYGAIDIHSPDRRVVDLRLGPTGPNKVWLNGELVWQSYRSKEMSFDGDIIQVSLRPGANRLLVKVTNEIDAWGFYFRATGEGGDASPGVEFRTPGKHMTASTR